MGTLIHDEDGMGIVRDVAGDLDQVLVHGVRVAPRHNKSCRFAVFGADRPEDVGRTGSLVVRRGRP